MVEGVLLPNVASVTSTNRPQVWQVQRPKHRKTAVKVPGAESVKGETPDLFLKVQCPSTQVLPKPSRPRGMDDGVASKEEGSLQWWFVVSLVFAYTAFVFTIAVLTTLKVKDWASAVLLEKEEWRLSPLQCTLSPATKNAAPTIRRRGTKVMMTRTVGVQSMCTYRRDLATPRFEWITPKNLDKVRMQE